MNVVIVIQARTSSARLPGKALLPVGGYPSAILAGLRAANRFHRTIFATSDHASDDQLAATARRYSLEIFRGPLNDVLARCTLATAALPDDSVVVRLTGDNLFPDGSFVDELVQAFVSERAEYMDTDCAGGRVPYGLGGEAFSVGSLRRANSLAQDPADREHVGPWMERNCRASLFVPRLPANEDFSDLRCTIDTAEDYRRVLRLFEGVVNPLEVGWLQLARSLQRTTGQDDSQPIGFAGDIRSPLTLGTAQLGMDYGRVNDRGKPSRPDAIAIVHRALELDIRQFDTARSYGESESLLGEALSERPGIRIITKLDLTGLHESADKTDVRRRVDESINSSCEELRTAALDVLLLHRWEYRHSWRGAAWQRLLEHRESGRVRMLGASLYEPWQAQEALEDVDIQHLQVPMNLLDWRWRASSFDRALKGRPDVTVHARSALLQGVLAHACERWPLIPGFDRASCARILCTLAEKFGRRGVADLCFAYVRAQSWISSIVVGCETQAQLEENLSLFSLPKLTAFQCEELETILPKAPEEFLNPSKWHSCEPVATYAS